MLHLRLEFVGSSTIVFCQGRLGWSEGDALVQAVSSMRNGDRFTLDLSGVPSIDARGLGALATIAKWALREGVTLLVSNPTRRVYDLICLVKLDSVIPMCAIEPTQAIELVPATNGGLAAEPRHAREAAAE
jgi:anti-anti-sigma factor